MNSMTGVLPFLKCPKCKKRVLMLTLQQYYYIRCEDCGIETRFYEDPIKLINEWKNILNDKETTP